MTTVGKLHYGGHQRTFDIDDRLLSHLRIVFMNKLRRAEPFMFHHTDTAGTTSLWIHPAVSLVFHFYGGRPAEVNRAWVEELMHEANSSGGLKAGPEPSAAMAGAGANGTHGRLQK